MEFDVAYYKKLLDHLAEGVYFTDCDRRILYWNQAAELLSGHRADDVLGCYCHNNILQHVDAEDFKLCDKNCPINCALAKKETVKERAFLLHKSGHRVPVRIKTSPVFDNDGALIGAVEIFSDATDQIELEGHNQGLRKLVRIDALTHLPNRRALLDSAQKEYLRFARYGTLFSLIWVDIDDFRAINESFGQQTADRALQWLARKLLDGFRKVDMVSRWKGQRFLVLLPNADARAAQKAAEKQCQLIAGHLCPETGSKLTASFGLTEVNRQDSIERILKRAERALKEAKKKGKNRVVRL